jgi:hypothetical protein
LIAEFRKTIFKMVKATTAYTPARDDWITIIEVADIQPIYADPNSTCAVKNTPNQTLAKEKFISPEPVKIFCNTRRPTEKSDQNTVEPIPTPPDCYDFK